MAGDPNSSTPGPEKHQASEQPEAKNDGSITGNEKNESEVGGEYAPREGGRLGSADSEQPMAEKQSRMPGHSDVMERYALGGGTAFDPNTYVNIHNPYDRQGMEMMNPAAHSAYSPSQCSISTYPDMSYSLQGQTPTGYTPNPPTFRMTTSSLSSYSIPGDGPSPGWMDMSSPPQHYQSLRHLVNHHSSQLRYPVLEPLVPHLENVIPLSLACDLIDLYFSSSSGAQMHPMSPYVLGFVFRKRPFLHPSEPRRCQPALLASMLWVAAQTSDSSFLTSLPSARGTICQKLLELTVSLLKPLIHTPSRGESLSPVSSPRATDGAALGGLGVALPGTISMEALTSETGPFGAAGTLDDVVTYIHLATVVSASEYKGASLRWWNAAWSLARELRLGRELPRTMSAHEPRNEGTDEQAGVQGSVTEEEREERRRTWWLAYIVDRHLALCYNRPLFLLDIECDGLLQPMDDTAFQNGEFQAPATFTDPTVLASGPSASQSQGRIRGPSFECSGPSIYGYFLPLMTILGEIVDLNHARNHPRLGVRFRPAKEWDGQAMEIERHLGLYEQSLKMFAQRNVSTNNASLDDKEDGYNDGYGIADTGTPPGQSVHSAFKGTSRMTESEIQTRIVVGYGTHVSHVLHILLTGKWDPVNLLDDNDLWLSSQAFIAATGHAVSAARAASHILDYDPGLEFMPFFFGIYLLQGSFLLLLVAEKLRNEASLSVVKACETITRAHEACVVTLNTEYQVSPCRRAPPQPPPTTLPESHETDLLFTAKLQ